jgi:hypothetical protein
MNPHKNSERGQAIVFLALGFVVFLGFVALAIDGGMLYSNRRNTKNAVDASSLSGGGAAALSLANSAAAGEEGANYKDWNCGSTPVYNAINLAENSAINRAGSNNFTIDRIDEDLNYADAQCDVDFNPSFDDKFIDVTVGISQTTEASFAQVLYPGKLTNVVSAVTRVRPMMPLVFGNAIVALRQDCPNQNTGGIHFDGNSQVNITGGGLFSNACIVAGGTVDVNVIPPDTENICLGEGCYTDNGSAQVDPEPIVGYPGMPPYAYTVSPPNCNDVPFRGQHIGGGDIEFGRYTEIRLNNGTLNMGPGLYCITQDDFTVTGGTLNGSGVTIYLENGGYTSNGNASINLSACMAEPCQNFAMHKVLFYVADGNTGPLSLLGGAGSDYTGLVYGVNAMVEIGGGGSLMGTIHVQVVADTVFIHGNSNIEIVYDDAQQLWKSAQIELYK